MKTLENKDIKKKSDAELVKACTERGEALLKLRFDVAGSVNQKGNEARNLRRDIARLKTEMRARELNNK